MRESVRRARLLLEDAALLSYDCGELCAKACCLPDEEGKGGVWLLPGEEQALAGEDWARILPGDIPMLMCQGPCSRALRPFFCRLFPLMGVRRAGSWQVRMDRRARPLCPLARSGTRGLNPAFVEAAGQAVALVGEDPVCAPILMEWARLEKRFSPSALWEAAHGED